MSTNLETAIAIKASQYKAALEEVREYFDQRADISDRTDGAGRPFPNEEMQMLNIIDEALGRSGY